MHSNERGEARFFLASAIPICSKLLSRLQNKERSQQSNHDSLVLLLLRIHFDLAYSISTPLDRAKYHIRCASRLRLPQPAKATARDEAYESHIAAVRPVCLSDKADLDVLHDASNRIIRALELNPDHAMALQDAMDILKARFALAYDLSTPLDRANIQIHWAHPLAGRCQASTNPMAAPAAGLQSFRTPFAVAGRARFFRSWLRGIAPNTHQDQASGDESACRPGGFAAPEERWCRNVSNGFITDPWLPVSRRQSLGGSRCGRSACAANR